MSHIFDWIFAQYNGVPTHLIVLESIGVLFGLLSVIYSKRENILVFPTGIISTAIFVYILLVYGLLGDMMINAYYFSMSIYGWYVWTRKVDANHFIPITTTTVKDKMWSAILFTITIAFVTLVYLFFDKFNSWTAYVDTFTTAIFFVGMWLMAKKKIENWIYWIIGDVISVPLYLYKGLVFTALQYFVFTGVAILGYLAWKKSIGKSPQTLLK
ncbi:MULTISPECIES: nicotinamide riboside transporter PnuC [Cellulophaga]|uniref:Nicotinamide riboside transporter PnuC n=2 Tax=Cellulophaga TaxID=104264 RepID=F0RE78_CELLC|nr:MULTISPECIES: nicotinamide riboside transporter PnuC [Cellulophaga]ADY28840.1 nicotinamide mononucleotide transporter PnuC [Cellulophaga lytica DSM 7489]AIM59884.1 nicotinamide mononucleotide transporter [Cellulophaga lytica]APU09749.1 nicotinamide mononucleotide transporter [Cellulophaga lytica]EWH13131.1 nicotinamide mononucleotide transporter PnuC [Cellulophaga geojensis KL-A]MDO6855014.1 nicotinamide riboside transporter PnuC [Cellulophaga lytica]